MILGSLRSDDAMAAKKSLKKWIYVLPVFPIYFIKSRRAPQELNSQNSYPSSGAEIKFHRRSSTSSIKCKIRQFYIRPSRAKAAKKCTRKCEERAKLSYLLHLLSFDVLVAIASSDR